VNIINSQAEINHIPGGVICDDDRLKREDPSNAIVDIESKPLDRGDFEKRGQTYQNSPQRTSCENIPENPRSLAGDE